MDAELFNYVPPIIRFSTLPGALGGVALFLWGIKRGHYRNNKYFAKALLEIVGAMITATFVTMLLNENLYRAAGAFVIGVAWAQVIQTIRTKITNIVEAALGEKRELGKFLP